MDQPASLESAVIGGKFGNVDEHRRAIESLEPGAYETLSYYERWLVALESLLIEKGIVTRAEIDRKIEERADATR